MDRNTIKKEIIALVNSIKSQSDTLADEKYPSQIDLELFLHKVEKLYQKSIVFNHLSVFDGFEEPEPIQTPSVLTASSPVTEPIIKKEEKSAEQKVTPTTSVVQEIAPEIKNESKPNPAPLMQPGNTGKNLPDLKSTMGINDKFQFTNELFKGNMPEFNIAIEQLNASESIESAMNYLKSLHHLYGWEEEHETVKRFLSIIERRYN